LNVGAKSLGNLVRDVPRNLVIGNEGDASAATFAARLGTTAVGLLLKLCDVICLPGLRRY
jgi:hypothetical protein